MLAVNKVDNFKFEVEVPQFYQLGLGEPLPLSAYHGLGVERALNEVAAHLPLSLPALAQPLMKMAIVGHPNVGKSMLLNAILGQERVIVSETPGTTRDAIDTVFKYEDESIILIDTAGIRRRGKVGRGIEQYGVMRAMGAIDRADVALLVIDATEPLIAQDLHIAGYIHRAFKGIVVVINKWDLAEGEDAAQWVKVVRRKLKFMPCAPILFVSAKTKYGVDEILPAAKIVYEQRCMRLPTSLLNRVVREATAAHLPPAKSGRQLNIFYVTQAGVAPPTFIFFVNDAGLVHFSYRRYLENRLRRSFGFEGTPLHLIFKRREKSDS
jgi:GTP-binding protein